MNLRQKMKRGPVFGFAIFTGASSVIESVGNWGYDFVYLDVECRRAFKTDPLAVGICTQI